MRFAILILLCTISITASAQFWKKSKKADLSRFPELSQPSNITSIAISDTLVHIRDVYFVQFKRSIYEIELAEDGILKEAKRNMRFRIYDVASYNFSALADLYVLQNRFSEAKWYLLQSNTISREQNDDKHTISNLLNLAAIKSAIGETALARLDLQEAHDLANSKGFVADVATIEKKMHDLEFNKSLTPKAELRYAEAVEASNKPQ
jgi:hypothetical protein